MKLFAKLLWGITCFRSFDVFACSPTPPIYYQTGRINNALSSSEFQSAIKEQFDRNPAVFIKSVKVENSTLFELNNNCVIEVGEVYKKADRPGNCPEFEKFIVKTICPN